jgi:glycosyltransferase involved in cell wall biosynthesis
MAEGLRGLGHNVQVVELSGRLPDPDQVATDAALSVLGALPAGANILIDGLALPAFAGLALNRATGLIQHPAAMETGLSPETAQRLRAIETTLFRDVARLVVTSEPTADYLVRDFGAPRDHIEVIAPGIDDLPRNTGSAGLSCQILSVGALIPRKGHDVLLRALSRLFDIDWHLTIAGSADHDPVHADGLRALAEDLHIAQRVSFVDDVTDALWAGADLFALTSYIEGYGVAIAEALRRGLPVAVTNVGAVPTLVGPEAGVVCAPGDIEQLSKAMRRLIFDRALLRDMAQVARQSGQSLPSWNEQAQRLAAVLSA